MGLLNEALNEECRVFTDFGCRNELVLKDFDNNHALFQDKREGFVILPITEIRALEFENDESKD